MTVKKISANTQNGVNLGNGTYEFQGTIVKIRQFDSGWTIATLQFDNGKEISLTGDMPQIVDGMKVKIKATEVNHPKWGLQYKVISAEGLGFTSEDGIIRYLAGDDFFGVGMETAKAIVQHLGIETIQKLDENPELVYDIPGISAKRQQTVVENWQKARAAHKGLTELLMMGINPATAKRIEKYYGERTLDIVYNHPYELTKVSGVGFKIADDIAMRVGIGRESQVRIKACILYVLSESERSGHCYMYHTPLRADVINELGEDLETSMLVKALQSLEKANAITVEDGRIYLTSLWNTEREVVSMMKGILQYPNASLFSSLDEMREALKSSGVLGDIVLAPEQEDALFMALNNRVSIITGGPGTGKSTITKALISLFEMKNISYELCSPTGVAAKRLGNATEEEARTIHRMLEFSPEGDMNTPLFKRNEHNPLTANCVIIDEISMVDIRLFRHLLCAMMRSTRLVMVGDADQLPSVGAGNVLGDLIASGTIPVTRLKVIFRQKAGSTIISVAHDILNGVVPVLPTPKQSNGQNCMFVAASDIPILCNYIVTLVKNTLPSLGYGPDDIQVLTPMRGKGVGINDLNPLLQEALNPPSPNKVELQLSWRILRLGDRVMQIRNDYKKIVFNGEIGRICGITKNENGSNVVFVQYADKITPVEYQTEELDDLQLAYASTIHKCIKKGELVLSSEGYKCIETIEAGDKVAVGGNVFMKVLDKIESGVQKIYRLTTKAGYKIDVTDKHPILVYDTLTQREDFKLIKHISKTDNIIIDRTLVDTNLSKLSADISWLLGFTVGDGNYNKSNDDYRIEWSGHVNAIECFENVQKIINNDFGYDIKIYPKNKTKKDFSNIRACVFSKKIREHFLELGLDYVTCENKTIPSSIFQESVQNKMAFISGLIDSDGCVDKTGVRIVIKSEKLSHAVQMLLLNAGVISTVRKDYPDAYCVHVQGPSLQNLKQHLNLINKEKKFKLELLVNTNGKTNNDYIPNRTLLQDFLEVVPFYRGVKGKGLNSAQHISFGKRITGLKFGAKLNYSHLRQMRDYLMENDVVVPDTILDAISKNYYYDKLQDIQEMTEEATYDLEIENIHSFVCNGFVCHNSQGSEYPAVVLAMHDSHIHMLRRNLFYTGLTRAKKHCIIAGTSHAIARAVANDAQEIRNTTLKSLM